jgi:hypothetical protein
MTEQKGLELSKYVIEKITRGVGPLKSSVKLAAEYLEDQNYADNPARINSLINWEISKNATSGFVTGLGGLITMPVTIPAALGASILLQARMAGAIAVINGHSIEDDRVRTLILLSMVGDSAKEILKKAGATISQKITHRLIAKLPGKILIQINKMVGFRLITKAGSKGIINLTKTIPVIGGVVCGGFDAYACKVVGKAATEMLPAKHWLFG